MPTGSVLLAVPCCCSEKQEKQENQFPWLSIDDVNSAATKHVFWVQNNNNSIRMASHLVGGTHPRTPKHPRSVACCTVCPRVTTWVPGMVGCLITRACSVHESRYGPATCQAAAGVTSMLIGVACFHVPKASSHAPFHPFPACVDALL